MATFEQLKALSDKISKYSYTQWGMKPEVSAIQGLNFDSFCEHVPVNIGRVDKDFYSAFGSEDLFKDCMVDIGKYNHDIEPEDERDMVANNYAVSRLPELIPYLEQVNIHLTEDQINDPNYSHYALHLGSEILMAKDFGFSKECMDYLCDEAFIKDWKYFGCKHNEYATCDARRKFENEISVEDVRFEQNLPTYTSGAIRWYQENCIEHNRPIDREAVRLIGSAYNMEESYALEGCLSDGMPIKDATTIHDCISMLVESSKHPELNHMIEEEIEFDGKKEMIQVKRFSADYADAYVESYKELLNKGLKSDCFKELTADFIANNPEKRWPADHLMSFLKHNVEKDSVKELETNSDDIEFGE